MYPDNSLYPVESEAPPGATCCPGRGCPSLSSADQPQPSGLHTWLRWKAGQYAQVDGMMEGGWLAENMKLVWILDTAKMLLLFLGVISYINGVNIDFLIICKQLINSSEN